MEGEGYSSSTAREFGEGSKEKDAQEWAHEALINKNLNNPEQSSDSKEMTVRVEA